MTAGRGGLFLCLAVPPLLAAIVYFVTVTGGFLSDDLLLNYLLDVRADEPRVLWGSVIADLTRPWLGIEGGVLYRPIMSLSYALDLWLGAGSPLPLHLTNVFAHAVSSFCVGLLSARIQPGRAGLAAVLGGGLFAAHPAGVESVAWISGRVSSLETMWSLLCLCIFVQGLGAGRRVSPHALGMALFALWTKESAIVLPVSLLAVDLVWHLAGNGTLRARELVERHAAFVPVWIIYVLLRWFALGTLGGSVMQEAAQTGFLDGLAGKLGALLFGGTMGFAPAALAGWVIVALVAVRLRVARRLVLLAVTAGWILAHFVPSYQLAVAGLGGSRIVYGAVPCLSLLVAAALGGDMKGRLASLTPTLLLLALLGWLTLTSLRVQQYGECWRLADEVQNGVLERAQGTTAERPVAIVEAPATVDGIAFLNPNAVFPLFERPFAEADHPVIGLGFLLVPIPDNAGLFRDASPLRALNEQGARLLAIRPGGRIESLGAPPRAPGGLRRKGPRSGRFDLVESASPYHIEMLVVRARGKPPGGKLSWLPKAPGVPDVWFQQELGAGVATGDETEFRIDLSHSITFLAQERLQGIHGFEIALEGVAPDAIVSARAIARLPRLALRARLAGERLTLGEEGSFLVAPRGLDVEREMRLVVLGPHAGTVQPVQPDAEVRFAEHVAGDMRRIDRVYRQKRFWYYFEERSKGTSCRGGARSAVDWFTLEVPAR